MLWFQGGRVKIRKIIGKILNRDRSLINYYEHTHKPNYASYPLYRETFNKIYKAYKKTLFEIKKILSIFLSKNL